MGIGTTKEFKKGEVIGSAVYKDITGARNMRSDYVVLVGKRSLSFYDTRTCNWVRYINAGTSGAHCTQYYLFIYICKAILSAWVRPYGWEEHGLPSLRAAP